MDCIIFNFTILVNNMPVILTQSVTHTLGKQSTHRIQVEHSRPYRVVLNFSPMQGVLVTQDGQLTIPSTAVADVGNSSVVVHAFDDCSLVATRDVRVHVIDAVQRPRTPTPPSSSTMTAHFPPEQRERNPTTSPAHWRSTVLWTTERPDVVQGKFSFFFFCCPH